jgi:hypothetical protein
MHFVVRERTDVVGGLGVTVILFVKDISEEVERVSAHVKGRVRGSKLRIHGTLVGAQGW